MDTAGRIAIGAIGAVLIGFIGIGVYHLDTQSAEVYISGWAFITFMVTRPSEAEPEKEKKGPTIQDLHPEMKPASLPFTPPPPLFDESELIDVDVTGTAQIPIGALRNFKATSVKVKPEDLEKAVKQNPLSLYPQAED